MPDSLPPHDSLLGRTFPRSYWSPQFRGHVHAAEFLATPWRTRIRMPPPDDPPTARDLELVRELKARRTGEVVRDIERQAGPTLFEYFAKRLMFREASHPRTFELLWGGTDIGSTGVMYYKDRDNRARPAQYDPTLFPVLETPGHPSYPSGHSTQGHLITLTLAHLVPAATSELEALAWQIAVNREIAGLHFRSDTEAGRELARQIFAILLDACPGYRRTLVEAAAEWR